MRIATTCDRRFSIVAAILFVIVGCGTDDNASHASSATSTTTGGTAGSSASTTSSSTGSQTGSGGAAGSGDTTGSGGSTSGTGGTHPTNDGGPKPKAIGSPCAMDLECAAGLQCDVSFEKGMCTKACAMDADCGGKGGAMGVCLMSLCYASCDLTSDASAAADGGMVAPCKNKSFACMDAPGHPTMVCAPNPNADAGHGDGAAGGDASVE